MTLSRQTFDSAGVAIAYDDIGSGPPIALVHGFASNRERNWKAPRWYDTLTGAGRRVVALDCRGHGESDKPHDPAAYALEVMAGDVIHLLDHLGLERVDLMGYSMGARIAAALLARHGERFGAGILAGIGADVLYERRGAEAIARALEADSAASVAEPSARAFRVFAEQSRADLRALAACSRGLRAGLETGPEAITAPVLVVAGENDNLVTDPRSLVAAMPDSELLIVPRRDHLSTVGDRLFKETVLRFLQERGAPSSPPPSR